MVSETPLGDRCGARVTDKVGLEVQLDSDSGECVLTDDVIERIRLYDPDAGVTIEGPAIYRDIREYLWDDYVFEAMGIDPEETNVDELDAVEYFESGSARTPETHVGSKQEGLRWYRFDDSIDVQKITNARGELQGYCERYPMDNGYCYNHQPGGAFEGNTNSLKHGLYAQRTNFYKQLDDEEKGFVESMVDEWIEMSPYDRDNAAIVNELYRTAIDQLRAWYGVEEFAGEDGLTTEQVIGTDDTGAPIEAVDEHPANLPYSRLDRDIQSKLKELNVYDSPDSEQAEATHSLAQKLSGLTDN